jgi:hypothetical protein
VLFVLNDTLMSGSIFKKFSNSSCITYIAYINVMHFFLLLGISLTFFCFLFIILFYNFMKLLPLFLSFSAIVMIVLVLFICFNSLKVVYLICAASF